VEFSAPTECVPGFSCQVALAYDYMVCSIDPSTSSSVAAATTAASTTLVTSTTSLTLTVSSVSKTVSTLAKSSTKSHHFKTVTMA